METMVNGCCDICGIPLDAEYFDVSGILEQTHLPVPGESTTIASFQIHPQYCGVLMCFSQFTDAYAENNSLVETPGLLWQILRNGQPLSPYHKIESILNPWGYNNYSFMIRLDENSKVEFVIKNRAFDYDVNEVTKIGGRLVGRYWYNRAYGKETKKSRLL
ncbi:MAG: hypothetical protein ACE5I1_01170 [bacterium]